MLNFHQKNRRKYINTDFGTKNHRSYLYLQGMILNVGKGKNLSWITTIFYNYKVQGSWYHPFPQKHQQKECKKTDSKFISSSLVLLPASSLVPERKILEEEGMAALLQQEVCLKGHHSPEELGEWLLWTVFTLNSSDNKCTFFTK